MPGAVSSTLTTVPSRPRTHDRHGLPDQRGWARPCGNPRTNDDIGEYPAAAAIGNGSSAMIGRVYPVVDPIRIPWSRAQAMASSAPG
jgi:hypothetical protein